MSERPYYDVRHLLGCFLEIAKHPFLENAEKRVGINGIGVTLFCIVTMPLIEDYHERFLHLGHQPSAIQQTQRVADFVIVLEKGYGVCPK